MDLHVKYRPTEFAEVVGQEHAVRSIQSLFNWKKVPHAFLFSGPSGVGKTTLARIIGTELGCPADRILEIDAASNSGVGNTRELVQRAIYRPIGGQVFFLIVDECHSLSSQAWQPFLKAIEEPGAHAYFAFCTTELHKVPKTIKTRCHAYDLVEVSQDDIHDFLEEVIEEEQFDLEDSAVSRIAREAQGSVRQALVYLSMCSGCETAEQVEDVLKYPGSRPEVIDLCRKLAKPTGKPFAAFRDSVKVVADMQDVNPEGCRIVILNYMSKALLSSKDEGSSRWLHHVIACFSGQYISSEGIAPLLLSLGDTFGLSLGERDD